MNFAKYPVLRGLVPYISGILLARYFLFYSFNLLIVLILSATFILVVWITLCKFFHSLQGIGKFVFFVLFLLSGFAMTNIKNFSASFFLCQEQVCFSGKQAVQILENPCKKGKSVRVIAKIKNSGVKKP